MKGSSKPFVYATFLAVALVLLYRPLPANFTDNCLDRIAMYVVELVLRFSYVYPGRLCPNAYCQLAVTRFSLEHLVKLIGPWTLYDPDVTINDIRLDSVPTRVYVPRNRSSDGAIVFIHGGGFVLGNVAIYESMVRQIAKDSGMVTFSLDYRLAPEHVFPAGLNDCERAVVHVLKHSYKDYGFNRERVALMGDSAGGGLVATLTHRLRHRRDLPQPKAQVLMYPLLQVHNLRTPSYEYYYREMAGTAFVDPRLVAQYYMMYAGIDDESNAKLTPLILDSKHLSRTARQHFEKYLDLNLIPEEFKDDRNVTDWPHEYDANATSALAHLLQNPEFTPMLQSDLTKLPKALVVTMEYDVLRDEGTVYANRLRTAGIPTTWKHFPTGFHAMLNFNTLIETSRRIVRYVSKWTRENV